MNSPGGVDLGQRSLDLGSGCVTGQGLLAGIEVLDGFLQLTLSGIDTHIRPSIR